MAQVFKKLISIDQKPDITLNLLSTPHFQDLFTCLQYLEENQGLALDLQEYFARQTRFNNYLGLSNQEVIENIHNNFRIGFLKEFVLPNFLSDSQIDEMNTFVLLHNNTIICHIDGVMAERMAQLDRLLLQRPRESLDFFTELFAMLRSSFNDLKTNFTQNFLSHSLHEKVLAVLIHQLTQTPPAERPRGRPWGVGRAPDNPELLVEADPQAMEVPGASRRDFGDPEGGYPDLSPDHRALVVQASSEIVCFLCRSFPKSLVKILSFKWDGRSLLQLLPEWTEVPSRGFPFQVLDFFRVQPTSKSDVIDEDCIDFFIDELLPFLAAKIREKGATDAGEIVWNFWDFSVELCLLFFTFGVPRLSQAVLRTNLIADLARVYTVGCSKNRTLRYLKLLKEHLGHWNKADEVYFDLEGVLDDFVGRFVLKTSQRNNILKALVLGVLKTVAASPNKLLAATLLKLFDRCGLKQTVDSDCFVLIEEARTLQAAKERATKATEGSHGSPREQMMFIAPANELQALREWIADVPSGSADTFESAPRSHPGKQSPPRKSKCPGATPDPPESGHHSITSKPPGLPPNKHPPSHDGLLRKRDFLDGG